MDAFMNRSFEDGRLNRSLETEKVFATISLGLIY
jgi:hypothetical protein